MNFDPQALKDLLDDSGYPYKPTNKSYVMDCPRCGKDSKLYIRKNDGRFKCFYCATINGFKGWAEWALLEFTGLGLQEIQAKLYGEQPPQAGLLLSPFPDEDFLDVLPSLVKVEPPPDIVDLDSPYAKAGVNYLKSRGVSLEVALRYGVKYWPSKGSVYFPVVHNGDLVGWQSRRVGATEFFDGEWSVSIPKTLTKKDFKKELSLMFEDRIQGDHCVLCEGPFDALKADLCGGNVATMGKEVSKAQLDMILAKGVTKLYLALDPDAYQECAKIVQDLDIDVFHLVPPYPYGDLGEMPPEEVYGLFKAARKVNRTHLFLHLAI